MADTRRVVKETWFAPDRVYVGRIGTVIETMPSTLDSHHDGLRLRFDDGEVRMFARHETRRLKLIERLRRTNPND